MSSTERKCVRNCPEGTIGIMPKLACIDGDVCPRKQYLDPNERICHDCSKKCLFCKGMNENDCITCEDKLLKLPDFILDSPTLLPLFEILNKNPNDYNFEEYMKTILGSLRKGQNARIQCGQCDPAGFYLDLNSMICKRCQPNCLTCPRKEICHECNPGFFYQIDSKNCMQKANITAALFTTSNPQVFLLNFSDFWEEFFEQLIKPGIGMSVKVQPGNLLFSFKVIEGIDEQNFFIQFSFARFIEKGSILTLTINERLLSSPKMQLTNPKISVKLKGFMKCKKNEMFDPGKAFFPIINYVNRNF